MREGPHALIILDGWGYSTHHNYNAIYSAHPQNFDSYMKSYPHTFIKASGHYVGLLDDMIGNSEVGHLTIGSGRIIKQPITLFHDAITNGSLFIDPMLIKRFQELAQANKPLHFMGLLSDAGVHSHEEDLYALMKMAIDNGIKDIVIHPFLDGRDVPPKSAKIYLERLDTVIKNLNKGVIGTIHGRFYAMDRDNHWDRIEKSYRVLTQETHVKFHSWQKALEHSYNEGITDEFFVPISIKSKAYIKDGDGVLFFNFRPDRARELTEAFLLPQFHYFPRTFIHLAWMITSTNYRSDFPTDVIFNQPIVTDTFFDCLEQAHMRIFTIAETEKYAHVTYFFNGGREIIHRNETRVLIPSKRHYKTYAKVPCMSAPEITDTIIRSLSEPYDFYLVNYANADMVGHSGNFEATKLAIECLDRQLKKLYDNFITKLNGTLYITADHGKAEEMYNENLHQPRTAHTTNDVPFLLINNKFLHKHCELPLTQLSDIAPFILEQLKLPIPQVMGSSYARKRDNY